MRNLSLEQFYRRIHNKIITVGGYLEDKYIPIILKSCRLKPISIFNDDFDINTMLETIWIDEFNNIIEIRNKKLKLKLGAADINQTSTDIWRNETPKFLAEHSHKTLIGLTPDSEDFVLILTGSDNYLRCWIYQNSILTLCSPLVVGLNVLRYYLMLKMKNPWRHIIIKSDNKKMREMQWYISKLPIKNDMELIEYTTLRRILDNGE